MAHRFLHYQNNRLMPPKNWTPPPPAVHKSNIDWSFAYANGTAGIGGILRNEHGQLIQAFACAIVARWSLEAELQAFLRGIQMCVDQDTHGIHHRRRLLHYMKIPGGSKTQP
ncbi:germin-like protein subfamily 1 member 17 [Cinnamomum micranthum f. kanehirae]|uniref:Germin-like protein subfamily 1 member 17 n=1 Tax=Cinnamomum micranthum f. kanehirae TaxID=337451 RepID=A0A443P082_9MAGN|nr:germin-like protein subfamily 1 member 17 [Cinnamomum micranthum f. kanehirae]